MDQLDEASAKHIQNLHMRFENGFWNTGEMGKPGTVVEEPINPSGETANDSIKRYTDKYLPRKTIGHTKADFEFNRSFLPNELHKFVGLSVQESNGQAEAAHINRSSTNISRVMRQNDEEGEKPAKNQDDDDEEKNEEEEEDEFEESEDDDYNAEKYFDDGDDFGEGDDDDGEAAY